MSTAQHIPAITPSHAAGQAAHLARACACGEQAGLEGQCPACKAAQTLGGPGQVRLGGTDTPLEREADSVAEQVMAQADIADLAPARTAVVQRMPEGEEEDEVQRAPVTTIKPVIQRMLSSVNDEHVQAKPASTPKTQPQHPVSTAANAVRGGGQPLSRSERSFFEPRFGRDLGFVRLHTGPQAQEAAQGINARAYALGNHIAFARGEYAPSSSAGRRLIAHELTHTLQQQGGRNIRPALIQRENKDKAASDDFKTGAKPAAELESTSPTVLMIKIACAQGYVVLQTTKGDYIYQMQEPGSCSITNDEFPARVKIEKSTVTLEPSQSKLQQLTEDDQKFQAGFKVRRDQENPATLLDGQSSVTMKYVDSVPDPKGRALAPREEEKPLKCIKSFPSKTMFKTRTKTGELFPSKADTFKVFSLKVPIGALGLLDLDGSAGYSMDGGYQATFGPGELTDICLLTSAASQSATEAGGLPLPTPGAAVVNKLPPEYRPSAEMAAQLAAGKAVFGGQARFNLPAKLIVQIKASGNLEIALKALKIIDLGLFGLELTARGTALLAGAINANARVIWDQEKDRFEVDADAAIGGAAELNFDLDASMYAELGGFEVWRQVWNMVDGSVGIGWTGSMGYTSRDGLTLDKGKFAVMTGEDEIFMAQTAGAGKSAADAKVDNNAVMDKVFDENKKGIITNKLPKGTKQDPHPFLWYKPLEIYKDKVDLPNAERPKEVKRTDKPTDVYWYPAHAGKHAPSNLKLGVADWPSPMSPPFKYRPYVGERGDEPMPNQRRFNARLDEWGFDRTGLDAEHVWDVGLRGPDLDRFNNLWPAKRAPQQKAGTDHLKQITALRASLKEADAGDLDGKYLKITGLGK